MQDTSTANPISPANSRSEQEVFEEGGFLSMVRELWTYRELFYFFAWRDVKVRYKQTVLGIAWAVIQPFLTMVVFTLLFGRLANIPSDGIPRPVFYFSALLPWTYLSTTVSNAGMSLVSNAGLLTKIYFPRIILPASVALSGVMDFLIGSAFLAGFIAYYHIPLSWHLLLWPVLAVPLVLLALSVGMLLAALNVRYRDIKYVIPFGIQLWLFITPIIYPTSIVPEEYQWLMALNPLSGLIEAFRYSLVSSLSVHWNVVGISLATTTALFVAAVIFFRRTERTFADII
jgi:lipopolysaccharide transport system permease protein